MRKGELRGEIGRRLRKIRDSKGMTLEEVAGRVGLHYSYLAKAERGERNLTLETLERILTALEVEPYEAFSVTTAKGDAVKAPQVELIGNLLSRMSPEVRDLYLALGRELTAKKAGKS
jgi:transcriptional regulator with XRE-family HTH domain